MSAQENMSPIPSDANLDFVEAQDRMAALPAYYRWVLSVVRPYIHGRVLDLGCGSGLFLSHYLLLVREVVAVDLNSELLRKVATSCRDPRVHTVQADLAGDWDFVQDNSVDTVIALDILEHLEDDLSFLRKAAFKLRHGGSAVLKVAAQRKLYGDIDRHSGHFRRYERDDLLALSTRVGFEVLVCRHWNPLGAWLYRHRRNRPTNFSRTFSPGQLKVLNTLIPVLRLLDGISFLKGLSLIGVFRKS